MLLLLVFSVFGNTVYAEMSGTGTEYMTGSIEQDNSTDHSSIGRHTRDEPQVPASTHHHKHIRFIVRLGYYLTPPALLPAQKPVYAEPVKHRAVLPASYDFAFCTEINPPPPKAAC